MQQFYYDMLKILSKLSSSNTISCVEKESMKNVILNSNSQIVQRLNSLYVSEDIEKNDKIVSEIITHVKLMRQKSPKPLKPKQMRIITEETEELEEEFDEVLLHDI